MSTAGITSRPAAASAGRGLFDALTLAVVTVLDTLAVSVRTVVGVPERGSSVVVLEKATVVDVSTGGVVDVTTTMLVTLPGVEDAVAVAVPLSVAEPEVVGMTV